MNNSIQACEVFPNVIEALFMDLIVHVDHLASIENSLQSVKNTPMQFPELKIPDNASSKELKEFADHISDLNKELASDLQTTNKNHKFYDDKSKEIRSVLKEIIIILNKLIKYKSYDPHCTKVNQGELYQKVNEAFNKCNMIDYMIKVKIKELIRGFTSSGVSQKSSESTLSLPSIGLIGEMDIERLLNNEAFSVIESSLVNLEDQQASIKERLKELNSIKESLLKEAEEKEKEEKAAEIERLKSEEKAKQKEDKKQNEEGVGSEESENKENEDIETDITPPIEEDTSEVENPPIEETTEEPPKEKTEPVDPAPQAPELEETSDKEPTTDQRYSESKEPQ